ncbi:MAG: helix-turn-helix transcriptional regulator [Planctomycetes bacterium]|nr:helix-turn-helix transcriptional regulator [Planctomycetota bacterium]
MKLKPSAPPIPSECPLEACLRLLAGAWTPQILWYARPGPQRFGELKRAVPGVSAKVLTTRLRELEARGILQRTVLPSSPPAVEYALTDLGREFIPVLDAIAAVGGKLRKSTGKSAPRAKSASAR